jgi:SAM-dependent methyltransferase
VSFDSRGSCVSTYAEALDRVTSRFWTTTYLSSGFWNQNNPLVLNSNRRMLERLAAGGDVRRLFLVQQPLRDEVAACREHHVLDRKLGRHASSSRRRLEFRHMKQNVEQMLLAGCRVRVAHDAAEAHRTLPGPMDFQANDSELAVYDNARVDVFEGGSAGRITGVRCFTPATRMFEAYLDQSVRYFEQLWESGRDITDFLRELEDAYESAEGRIDYESNWLAFYEFSLPHADATLKTVEIKRVEEILRGHHKWGQLRRCLDIGTCTGRYPLFLAEGLDSGGEVIGIDDDFDCVRFAAANVARQLPHEHRIRIEQVDFTSASGPLHGPFDVITCMLGTLSHFGRGRCQPFEPDASDDLLQACLKRMRTLLADDGLLVLGTWSDHARLTGQMLGIYRDSERQRLAEWTPPLHELRARLAAAGLTAVDTARPDLRLDLTVCRSAAAAAAAAQEAA